MFTYQHASRERLNPMEHKNRTFSLLGWYLCSHYIVYRFVLFVFAEYDWLLFNYNTQIKKKGSKHAGKWPWFQRKRCRFFQGQLRSCAPLNLGSLRLRFRVCIPFWRDPFGNSMGSKYWNIWMENLQYLVTEYVIRIPVADWIERTSRYSRDSCGSQRSFQYLSSS